MDQADFLYVIDVEEEQVDLKTEEGQVNRAKIAVLLQIQIQALDRVEEEDETRCLSALVQDHPKSVAVLASVRTTAATISTWYYSTAPEGRNVWCVA